MMRTVLVTGASGFVGRATAEAFRARGWQVRTAGHSRAGPKDLAVALSPEADWSAAVAGCDCVVHLAARAHILTERSADPLAEFMRINAEATLTLARAAIAAGVRRFVFMSSIAVNGPETAGPLRELDKPRPESDYGRSKLRAEQGLLALVAQSSMQLTILRPPLVYGPGVGARFLQLLKLAGSGLPLPLGGIDNRRSLISVMNLTDAIVQCADRVAAAGQTFLVADDTTISTPDLIRALARHLERPARLLAFPEPLLLLGAGLIGRADDIRRLTSSLVLDTTRINAVLGWFPPITLDAGLEETAKWYRNLR